MTRLARQTISLLLLPLAALLCLMVSLGWLVTRVAQRSWPLSVEDSVNRGLAARRTGWLDAASLVASTMGNTPVIIAVTALGALALRWWLGRWWESLYLITAVSAQALVFLLTTMAIDRQRPDVVRLDDSPPTSSFPSGHTSAAVALYGGLALVLIVNWGRERGRPARWWALLLLAPLCVAGARLYRGMHHPSDVTASWLNAGLCIAIAARALLPYGPGRGRNLAARAVPERTVADASRPDRTGSAAPLPDDTGSATPLPAPSVPGTSAPDGVLPNSVPGAGPVSGARPVPGR